MFKPSPRVNVVATPVAPTNSSVIAKKVIR